MVDFTNMIGRKLDRVELSGNKQFVRFHYLGGDARAFGVDSECCSTSWIEHLELPGDVAGAEILSVDHSAPVTQDHPEHDDGGECIEVYNTAFHTNRGDIVLEYRNSSNGYYGGWLVDAS